MENSTPLAIPTLQDSLLLCFHSMLHNSSASPLLSLLTKPSVYFPLLLGAYVIYTRYFTGLTHIPGPFSGSISNFWKISAAWHEEFPQRNIAAHRKYGPLVRVGPNMISVDDPAALNIIYGFKPIYLKVDSLLPIVEAPYKGKLLAHLFTTRSEKYHAHLKRASVTSYSMATLADLETHVDPVIALFLRRIEEVGENGAKTFDIGTWLQYFTFDVLGEVNFSEQLGFLETGTDRGKSIATIDGLLAYLSVVGQAPWMHKFLLGNPILHKILPIESSNEVQNFAIEMIDKRKNGEQKNVHHDILARLLEVNAKDPTKLSSPEIIALTTANLIAGSDSTAIGLRAILYFLCRTPLSYTRLQSEIDSAFESGALSSPVRYADGTKLEYLNAVITEALRAHAATGFVLEREVPEGGVTLAGEFVPQGTIVGINSWVMHANTSVYGEDAQEFRPERWLEEEEERVREMKRCNMAFGAGPRVCIGRNISMMEFGKFIPELMRKFDFRLAEPEKEWKVLGHWFTKQTGMDIIFTKRVHA